MLWHICHNIILYFVKYLLNFLSFYQFYLIAIWHIENRYNMFASMFLLLLDFDLSLILTDINDIDVFVCVSGRKTAIPFTTVYRMDCKVQLKPTCFTESVSFCHFVITTHGSRWQESKFHKSDDWCPTLVKQVKGHGPPHIYPNS